MAGPLTQRQYQIAMRFAAGETSRQIAQDFYITQSTVTSTVSDVYHKLGARDRGGLLMRLQELGHHAIPPIAQPPPPPPPRPPESVTPAQALFLEAFERFYEARHESQAVIDRARAEMGHLLGTMCIERRIEPKASRPAPSPFSGKHTRTLRELLALLEVAGA